MAILKKFNEGNRRPEITVDTPEKKGVFLFFELFLRKFWNYVKLNLLYFGTSIISILIYWFVLSSFVVPVVMGVIPEASWKVWADALNGMPVDILQGNIIFIVSLLGALLLVTFFGGGVCSAGYHYILRNYARQENAFFLHDFFGQTKKNFAQAIIVSIIDKVVICLCLFSASAYYAMMKTSDETFPIIAFAVMIFVLLIYAAIHNYIWTMMVTFKVNIKQLYKNSLLLTFGTAVRSIGYIVGVTAFTIVMTLLFAYVWIAALGVFMLIAMAAFNLCGHLVADPVIKKYMIDNNNENDKGNEE